MKGESSKKTGMGAIPYSDSTGSGVTFRVWSIFASNVFVAGTFNEWSTSKTPLFPEGNGIWSADVPGVELVDRYKYVIISPYINGIQWRTDPYCKSVLGKEDNFNGGIVSLDYNWDNDNFRSSPWNELVIYELHVASFNRNSGLQNDFSCITQKLDYLRDLGINAIEIMPIIGFPDDYSLGYDPVFPFDVETNYGNPNDFKDFVKSAHSKGIAIIMDIVINHYGPNDLDQSLWRFDGWNQDSKGGIYFYNDWRSYTPFGDRPDYGRGEVRQFIRDNVVMWVEDYHVDGLRFDSTVNIRNVYGNNNDPCNDLPEGWSLMQWLNNEVDGKTPWKFTIAEDLQNNDWITLTTGAGGAGFDSQWDSFYYWKIYNSIVAINDSDRNMFEVSSAIGHIFDSDICKRIVYVNNHDQCAAINNNFRLTDRIWMGHADSWVVRKRYTLAASILFTTPGVPMIFQGDEFLEWGSWDPKGTLDWSKAEKFSGILNLYKSLIHLRRNWFNNSAGLRGQNINIFHINNSDKVIAFHRWEHGGPGDDVVVVANFANTSFDSYSIGFPRGGNWYIRFNSDWSGYSPDFGNNAGYDTTASHSGGTDGLSYSGNVGIGPYTVLILSQ